MFGDFSLILSRRFYSELCRTVAQMIADNADEK